jgi:hypothetical protein
MNQGEKFLPRSCAQIRLLPLMEVSGNNSALTRNSSAPATDVCKGTALTRPQGSSGPPQSRSEHRTVMNVNSEHGGSFNTPSPTRCPEIPTGHPTTCPGFDGEGSQVCGAAFIYGSRETRPHGRDPRARGRCACYGENDGLSSTT